MMKEVTQLDAGKSFGEKAIEEDKPRAATVYCRSQNVVLATLTRHDYHKVIGDSFRSQMDLAIKCMRQFEIFTELSDLRLKSIYYYFKEINATKDRILYRQGEKT
jgi:CRP-like cAMP-binding protein